MEDFWVRLAVPADRDAITDFNYRLAQETEDLSLDREVLERGVAAILNDAGKGIYFVAECKTGLAGQVMVTYEWSDWRNGNIWWLQSVYVHPDWRGQGVFRRLFEHCRDQAAASPGVCGIRLYMHRSNAQARKVYEKLGFENTSYEVFELPLR